MGVKSGRCLRLTTLPLSCTVVMKSGDLNFLEPSGPLQACNETALPTNEMGGACGMCMREEWCMRSEGGGNSGKKTA